MTLPEVLAVAAVLCALGMMFAQTLAAHRMRETAERRQKAAEQAEASWRGVAAAQGEAMERLRAAVRAQREALRVVEEQRDRFFGEAYGADALADLVRQRDEASHERH